MVAIAAGEADITVVAGAAGVLTLDTGFVMNVVLVNTLLANASLLFQTGLEAGLAVNSLAR